jgi:hypothetical protein
MDLDEIWYRLSAQYDRLFSIMSVWALDVVLHRLLERL